MIFSARHMSWDWDFLLELYEYKPIMSWLSVWLWFLGRQTTNGTLWRLQSPCVSHEKTLWLLSCASCVLCMCWIKCLFHLYLFCASFAHCADAQIRPEWWYKKWKKWPLYYRSSFFHLKTQWINERSFICVDLFLIGSFLISSLIFLNRELVVSYVIAISWFSTCYSVSGGIRGRDIVIQERIWLDKNL